MSGMYDARISAWVAAQDFLAAATELQRKFPDEPSAAAHIDRYHRAADIYARLASAPARVGQAAGDAIARREEVEEERRRMTKSVTERFAAKLNKEADQ